MSSTYPRDRYRKFSKNKLRQGDIAVAEFHQLRARSGDRAGPGTPDLSAPDLPFLGPPLDYSISVPTPGGGTEDRVLRVWQGFVLVLHQNCEIEFGNDEDSRVLISPISSESQWPEAPWRMLRENRIPGYFYLPPISKEEATELGLPDAWPESVVVLASSTLTSVGLLKPRREFALGLEMLPHLQDNLCRFYSVRGFAALPDLHAVRGKRIVRVVETNQSVLGPSRLVKVYLGENEAEVDDEDDETTVSYWGVRT